MARSAQRGRRRSHSRGQRLESRCPRLAPLIGVTCAVSLILMLGLGCGESLHPGPPVPGEPHWAAGLVGAVQRAEAARLGVAVAFEERHTGLRFVLIPGGEFQMGSPVGVGLDDEHPTRRVIVSPFYCGISEVTNQQYLLFRSRQSPEGDRAKPAGSMTTKDAGEFAKWVSEADGVRRYDLPTEAQWEYVCVRGAPPSGALGPTGGGQAGGAEALDVQPKPHVANALGIEGLLGNGWEMTRDEYKATYFEGLVDGAVDPFVFTGRGPLVAMRGGGAHPRAGGARCADRFWVVAGPNGLGEEFGIRLVTQVLR